MSEWAELILKSLLRSLLGKRNWEPCLQSEGEGAWGGRLLKEEGTGDPNF